MYEAEDQLVLKFMRDQRGKSLDQGFDLPLSILELTLQLLASVLYERGIIKNLNLHPHAMKQLLLSPVESEHLIVRVTLNLDNTVSPNNLNVDLTVSGLDGNGIIQLTGLELEVLKLNVNESLEETGKNWLALSEIWTPCKLDMDTELWNERVEAKVDNQLLVLSNNSEQADKISALSEKIAEITGDSYALWSQSYIPFCGVDKNGFDVDALSECIDDNPKAITLMMFLPDSQDEHAANEHINNVFLCVQALMRLVPSVAIQGYCVYLETGKIADVYHQSLSGLFRTVMMENPIHRYRCISSCDDSGGFSETTLLNLLQEWLCDETQAVPSAAVPMVRYEQGVRLVLTLTDEPVLDLAKSTPMFKERATYLMVGGLGAAGELICRLLGRRFRANLIIFSSRSESEVSEKLKQIRSEGATVDYCSVDILDAEAVNQQMKEINHRGIKINGVLHMARRSLDEAIINNDVAVFTETAAVKVQGTLNIDHATQDHPIEFFMMYSSMASFGLRGAASYAYSTAFQNAFARHRNALAGQGLRMGRCISICWGQWEVDGAVTEEVMASRLKQFSDLGVDSIGANDALAIMKLSLLSSPNVIGFIPTINKAQVRVSLGLNQDRPSLEQQVRQKIESFAANKLSRQGFSDYLDSLDEARITPVLETEILAAIKSASSRQTYGNKPIIRPDKQAAADPRTSMAPTGNMLANQNTAYGESSRKMAFQADEVNQKSGKQAFVNHIVARMEKALGVDKHLIEHDKSFQSYGLDSITAVQMTTLLEKDIAIQIPPNWLIEYATVNALAEKLFAEKKGETEVA